MKNIQNKLLKMINECRQYPAYYKERKDLLTGEEKALKTILNYYQDILRNPEYLDKVNQISVNNFIKSEIEKIENDIKDIEKDLIKNKENLKALKKKRSKK